MDLERDAFHSWSCRLRVTGSPGRPAAAGSVSGTPTEVTSIGAVAVWK
jgi:hypothetical protein